MSSARGSNRDAPMTDYERQKWANVERNKRQLESLALPKMNIVVQPSQPKKKTKINHNTSDAAIEPRNLRPRPQKSNVEIAHEQIIEDTNYEGVGEFLCDNEDLHNGTEKHRNGRGITTMNDIFSRTPDMPKIKIPINEFGQPVGQDARKLSSVIGCQVRRKIPLGFNDWRLVDFEKKDEVWEDIQLFYELDDAAKTWFMATAGRKWKEYKADLKEKFFDETLTDEELKERNGKTVNDADWNYLINFWRSPESEALAARGKSNRAKLQIHHTSGSVSHACRRHNLGQTLGRPPRRDELYIKTHTRKNGVPLRLAATTIDKLKAIVVTQPELKDRTIQQGDVFAAVCGVKEPRGRVRVLGLGPTPQEIGTPGLKAHMSTRMQMEIFARKKAERRMAEMQEKWEEERRTQGRTNVDSLSQHDSNSRQHESPRIEEHASEDFNDVRSGEYHNSAENEDYNQYVEENKNLYPYRHAATPSTMNTARPHNDPPTPSAMNITGTPQDDPPAPSTMNNIPTPNDCLPTPSAMNITARRNDGRPRFAHDTLIGKDVLLYGILRFKDIPVAMGTVTSTNPNTIVGG